MATDKNDLFWLSMNAYHEARGETFDGIKAVCHVVLNRAAAHGQSIKDVVLAPQQFSWANGGARPPVKEYDAFANCMEAAQTAINERAQGYTLSGADHYFAVSIPAPAWSKSMKQVAKIGNHIFFKE